MNELQIFKNEQFGEVRTLLIEDKPYFVGKDVASALGYKNTTVALQDNIDTEDKGVTKVSTLGGDQDTVVINESGLYALVFGSRLETAKKFKHWVTSEILPSIRKHGAYMTPETLEAAILNPDTMIKILTELKAERETTKFLQAKAKEDKPKVLFAEALEVSSSSILIGELAKLLKQNGVDIGQNRLFSWMRDNGYLMTRGESRNMPTQYSMDLELMEIRVRTINNPDGSLRETKTPKITGKGQVYFVNVLLKQKDIINGDVPF